MSTKKTSHPSVLDQLSQAPTFGKRDPTPLDALEIEAAEVVVDSLSRSSSGGGGKGKGSGSGRGGGRPIDAGNGGGPPDTHGEEGIGNNLSFPVIFPEGVTPLTLRGDMDSLKLTDPYFEPGEYNGDSNYWFHQKSEGNEWQAYNEIATGPIAIDKVDVGDALESARIALGRFVRIELALLKDIGNPEDPNDGQLAYYMENIDGQGKTEVQGTPLSPVDYPDPVLGRIITDNFDEIKGLHGPTYASDLATVYAPSEVMTLTIQKFESDPVTGLWNGEQWVGEGIGEIDYAANTAFGSELTVSGKVISGVSGKPFSFRDEGNYRITFEIEQGASIFLNAADPAQGEEGTQPYNVAGARTMNIVPDGLLGVGGGDTHNGLIYLDVQVPSTVAGDELTSAFVNLVDPSSVVI